MWFLQMAQLSTTMSHAHRATAFHYNVRSDVHHPLRILFVADSTFFTSNLFLPSLDASAPAPAFDAFAFAGAVAGASVMSTSAISTLCIVYLESRVVRDGGVDERAQLFGCQGRLMDEFGEPGA